MYLEGYTNKPKTRSYENLYTITLCIVESIKLTPITVTRLRIFLNFISSDIFTKILQKIHKNP